MVVTPQTDPVTPRRVSPPRLETRSSSVAGASSESETWGHVQEHVSHTRSEQQVWLSYSLDISVTSLQFESRCWTSTCGKVFCFYSVVLAQEEMEILSPGPGFYSETEKNKNLNPALRLPVVGHGTAAHLQNSSN